MIMFRILKVLLVLAVLSGVSLLGAGVLILQENPTVKAAAPPTAEDVAATRALVRDLRRAADAGPDQQDMLTTDVVQLNSALRLGARFVPGFRGRVRLRDAQLVARASVPVPWIGGRKWLNVIATVPEFEGAMRLGRVSAGGVALPPGLALTSARIAGNLLLGNGFGDTVVTAASAMQIDGRALAFRIALDDVGGNGVMRSAFGALRSAEMPPPEEIETYHRKIREAMDAGTLPTRGSYLPYIRFALAAALENATPETLPNAYTAAIFGLAKACGSKDFAMIAGRVAQPEIQSDTQPTRSWQTNCDRMSLNGRHDSRLHFTLSAALQAASNRGFAVSVGEFKELYDTISGSGGFDFTDMAANLSGIALSNAMMATPARDWPALLARIETEHDVIVPFKGLPGKIPQAQFKARFGDVESPAYKDMIARIEARIAGIGLYQEQ